MFLPRNWCPKRLRNRLCFSQETEVQRGSEIGSDHTEKLKSKYTHNRLCSCPESDNTIDPYHETDSQIGSAIDSIIAEKLTLK
jgi:hypothetical protein